MCSVGNTAEGGGGSRFSHRAGTLLSTEIHPSAHSSCTVILAQAFLHKQPYLTQGCKLPPQITRSAFSLAFTCLALRQVQGFCKAGYFPQPRLLPKLCICPTHALHSDAHWAATNLVSINVILGFSIFFLLFTS